MGGDVTSKNVKMPTGAILTRFLKECALDIHDIAKDDGRPIVKAEALARYVWKSALGWVEEDPDDPEKTITHRPDWRAISLIWDRVEGKAGPVQPEKNDRTLGEKVGEMAVAALNEVAETVADNG